jgi:hypothetical protein
MTGLIGAGHAYFGGAARRVEWHLAFGLLSSRAGDRRPVHPVGKRWGNQSLPGHGVRGEQVVLAGVVGNRQPAFSSALIPSHDYPSVPT